MQPDVLNQTKARLQKVIEVIKNDISTIRTGKASPSLVENLVINAYGGNAKMRLMELATIGSSDPQTLVITPFDHSVIAEIEKGIFEANIGVSPVVDGQIIRISLPPLSQERRQELIKAMKHKLENGKIMIRQARHEGMEAIKKGNDEGTIGEDEKSRLEKEVQRVVDDYIAIIDGLGEQKEAELLQI